MTHGVVAVGDSIINGGVKPARTAALSWAQWLAQAADLPFTKYAKGGATSSDVITHQLPRIARDYDVAAVTVGANDILAGWDAARYEANLTQILQRLAEAAPVVLVTNLPAVFLATPFVPRARRDAVPHLNHVVEEAAARHGAELVDISDFAGERLLRPDMVHPTSVGLTEIAARAAKIVDVEPIPVNTSESGLGRGAVYLTARAAEAGKQAVRNVRTRSQR